MERSLGLFGHELKPVSYFFCVFFLEKRNIFSFSLLKKTPFWCLLPVSGRFTPPSDPSSTTSLRMSWVPLFQDSLHPLMTASASSASPSTKSLRSAIPERCTAAFHFSHPAFPSRWRKREPNS